MEKILRSAVRNAVDKYICTQAAADDLTNEIMQLFSARITGWAHTQKIVAKEKYKSANEMRDMAARMAETDEIPTALSEAIRAIKYTGRYIP